jgi:hypothetical protein
MSDMESHVLFVELIKAFDTVNHELPFTLLKRFGAPGTLIKPIRKLATYKLQTQVQTGKQGSAYRIRM